MTTLGKQDMRIILCVHQATMKFGIPFLPPPSMWKRAAKLEESGVLEAKSRPAPTQPGCAGYVVTDHGIDAYNAALKKGGPV